MANDSELAIVTLATGKESGKAEARDDSSPKPAQEVSAESTVHDIPRYRIQVW
jgi:hypothetical protein